MLCLMLWLAAPAPAQQSLVSMFPSNFLLLSQMTDFARVASPPLPSAPSRNKTSTSTITKQQGNAKQQFDKNVQLSL